jgi:hypothetical protein
MRKAWLTLCFAPFLAFGSANAQDSDGCLLWLRSWHGQSALRLDSLGDSSRTESIARLMRIVNAAFGVRAEVVRIVEDSPQGAYASPRVPRDSGQLRLDTLDASRGTIFLRAPLDRVINESATHRDLTIAIVLAHEAAHLLQFRYGPLRTVAEAELHADFLAGWFVGNVSRWEQGWPSDSLDLRDAAEVVTGSVLRLSDVWDIADSTRVTEFLLGVHAADSTVRTAFDASARRLAETRPSPASVTRDTAVDTSERATIGELEARITRVADQLLTSRDWMSRMKGDSVVAGIFRGLTAYEPPFLPCTLFVDVQRYVCTSTFDAGTSMLVFDLFRKAALRAFPTSKWSREARSQDLKYGEIEFIATAPDRRRLFVLVARDYVPKRAGQTNVTLVFGVIREAPR